VTRYVAFLRAINVSGRRVTMDALRAPFEALGLDSVSTYIASGNVVFDTTGTTKALQPAIEEQLEQALGYRVEAFVRSAAQVAALVELEPFTDRADTDTYLVGFVQRKPTAAERAALVGLNGDADVLVVDGRELHWLIRGKSMDSAITPRAMDRALGQPITTRNITMLRKLAAKL